MYKTFSFNEVQFIFFYLHVLFKFFFFACALGVYYIQEIFAKFNVMDSLGVFLYGYIAFRA